MYIIVPFYNEENILEKKIANLQKLDYPHMQFILIDDHSTDRSFHIAQSFTDDRILLLTNRARGKTEAQNMAMERVSPNSIAVFNDCNVFLESESIKAIIDSFTDKVGGCSGNVTIWEEGTKIGVEGYHWQFEKAIKKFESAFGSVIGFDGGFYAIRSELFSKLTSDALSDFEQAIDILSKGYRVVFNPLARANEYETRELSSHFSARRRVTDRTLWALMRSCRKLSSLSWINLCFLFSNKYLRYYCYYAFIPALALLFWLLRKEMMYEALCIVGILLAVAGAITIVNKQFRRTIVVGIALYAGMYDFIRGKKIVSWSQEKDQEKTIGEGMSKPHPDQSQNTAGLNILFLAHRIPYPPNKGDKIRSYNEIRYLAKSHSIYLGTLYENESDGENARKLEKYCREICASIVGTKIKLVKTFFSGVPFSVDYFYDRKIQHYVDTLLSQTKIDTIICFCSSMAEYVFRTPLFKENGLKDICLVMDFVDLDSDKWRQYAFYSRFPLNIVYHMEERRLLRYEQKVNRVFHHSVFVSAREVNVFKGLYPEARNISVITNGVDSRFFDPKTRGKEYRDIDKAVSSPLLVFTGAMDYFANIDGVRWFCHKILPAVRKEYPKVQFLIVGNRPTRAVRKLSKISGVTVTGYVEDIREYYDKADIIVVPLRIARGMQNKVLEAMVTGNAVIATSNASEGINCHDDSDIVIANSELEFAVNIVGLLEKCEKRRSLGQKAAEHIMGSYSWDLNMKEFDLLLRKSA